MPKKVMKYNLKNSQPWPTPKRGKARAALKKPCSKKTTSMKKNLKVPYVRHGVPTKKSRRHRERCGRSIPDFLSTGRRLIQILNQDKLLRSWTGKTCPTCAHGVLGKAEYRKDRDQWIHRCNSKGCQARIRVEDHHPIFFSASGSSKTSLGLQAAILYCSVSGVPRNAAHLILDVDHKAVERIYTNRELAMAQHVRMKESKICYGCKNGSDWKDVEADEVDIGKGEVEGQPNKVEWEQWGGLVERGRPESLRLYKLKPALTKKRAPGPGPIRKKDWKPIAQKILANKKVILHTDGARAYKLKLDQVIHCNVVHKKKRVTVNGKTAWQKPHYTKVYNIKLPSGKDLKVKSGTQIIDRFWGHR